METSVVQKLLQTAFPQAELKVESVDGHHFNIEIAAAEFAGKNRIQQHQLVHNVLKEYLDRNEIHAISLKTNTIA